MTTYYYYTTTGNKSLIPHYEDDLEGTALKMKQTKHVIDNLSSKYELLMDEITVIKEKQKEASKLYGELKKRLVELAVDDNDEEAKETGESFGI